MYIEKEGGGEILNIIKRYFNIALRMGKRVTTCLRKPYEHRDQTYEKLKNRYEKIMRKKKRKWNLISLPW